MTLFDSAILVTFWLLLIVSVRRPQGWQQLCQKSRADWTLDLFGLGIQGVVIPAMQIGLLYRALHWLMPQAAHCIALPPLAGFFICTVLVDYGYYWNHRWLHAHGWALHRVHHTVTQLDVLGTSRNSLWSSFFILYLWVHALIIYLLQNPDGYLWGISLTAMLDLWRHSQLGPMPNSLLYNVLSPWLVLPQDHASHHASQRYSGNFGANLKIWDCLHRTKLRNLRGNEISNTQSDHRALSAVEGRLSDALFSGTSLNVHRSLKSFDEKTSLNLWQKLFYPFESL